MRRIAPVAVLVVLLLPVQTFAWGELAHSIICEIAFQEMDRPARDEVKRLISQDDEFRFFSESCSWADNPRQRPKDHFINVPRSFSDIHTSNCQMGASTCLFTAIEADKGVLEDDDASDAEKLAALKLLGHWVGDIHQPMHVSFEDDRGGNKIEETGACKYGLHAVWDDCIVRQGVGNDVRGIADRLRAGITDSERSSWTNSEPMNWANESFQITTSPTVQYCVKKDGKCWYSTDNEKLEQGEPLRSVNVDSAYIDSHKATVEKQLTKAGVRLGSLLNEVLD